jgi:sulfur-carrier protein
MVTVSFTKNIQRHLQCPSMQVQRGTVREVMEQVFGANEAARSYVLDDQGALRKHMLIFVNGQQIEDREDLSDPVPDGADVHVMQALSGG